MENKATPKSGQVGFLGLESRKRPAALEFGHHSLAVTAFDLCVASTLKWYDVAKHAAGSQPQLAARRQKRFLLTSCVAMESRMWLQGQGPGWEHELSVSWWTTCLAWKTLKHTVCGKQCAAAVQRFAKLPRMWSLWKRLCKTCFGKTRSAEAVHGVICLIVILHTTTCPQSSNKLTRTHETYIYIYKSLRIVTTTQAK